MLDLNHSRNGRTNFFENKCAYCGISVEKLEIDHVISINKDQLGEHRLGNLIPSCKECNSQKADKSFREFLDGKAEQIKKIELYMISKNYEPLGHNEQIKRVLNLAYEEVAIVAERYILIINELLESNIRS